MATTYTWNVEKVEYYVNYNGLSKAIRVVFVKCEATDGVRRIRDYYSFELNTPNPTSFIPFTSVNNATALSWAFAKIGADKTKIENELNSKLLELATPTLVTTTLPN